MDEDLQRVATVTLIVFLLGGALRYGCAYLDEDVRRDVTHHSHEYIESKISAIRELDASPTPHTAAVERLIRLQCELLPEEAREEVRDVCIRVR